MRIEEIKLAREKNRRERQGRLDEMQQEMDAMEAKAREERRRQEKLASADDWYLLSLIRPSLLHSTHLLHSFVHLLLI